VAPFLGGQGASQSGIGAASRTGGGGGESGVAAAAATAKTKKTGNAAANDMIDLAGSDSDEPSTVI